MSRLVDRVNVRRFGSVEFEPIFIHPSHPYHDFLEPRVVRAKGSTLWIVKWREFDYSKADELCWDEEEAREFADWLVKGPTIVCLSAEDFRAADAFWQSL